MRQRSLVLMVMAVLALALTGRLAWAEQPASEPAATTHVVAHEPAAAPHAEGGHDHAAAAGEHHEPAVAVPTQTSWMCTVLLAVSWLFVIAIPIGMLVKWFAGEEAPEPKHDAHGHDSHAGHGHAAPAHH